MTNHPIVPSPEQVDKWFDDAVRLNSTPKYYIARQAALWSADHELEECCEELNARGYPEIVGRIRTARRPKPPSLKEQALAALDDAVMRGDCITISDALPTLRRTLEALPKTDFRALCEELVKDLDDLRESSEGVAGFHLLCNGDLAPWDELSESGRYPWLSSFDRARAALAEQPVGPTDEELCETYRTAYYAEKNRQGPHCMAAGLRAVLARWGQP